MEVPNGERPGTDDNRGDDGPGRYGDLNLLIHKAMLAQTRLGRHICKKAQPELRLVLSETELMLRMSRLARRQDVRVFNHRHPADAERAIVTEIEAGILMVPALQVLSVPAGVVDRAGPHHRWGRHEVPAVGVGALSGLVTTHPQKKALPEAQFGISAESARGEGGVLMDVGRDHVDPGRRHFSTFARVVARSERETGEDSA